MMDNDVTPSTAEIPIDNIDTSCKPQSAQSGQQGLHCDNCIEPRSATSQNPEDPQGIEIDNNKDNHNKTDSHEVPKACAPISPAAPGAPFPAYQPRKRASFRNRLFAAAAAYGTDDHFWLVQHEAGQAVHMRLFNNVDEVEGFVLPLRQQKWSTLQTPTDTAPVPTTKSDSFLSAMKQSKKHHHRSSSAGSSSSSSSSSSDSSVAVTQTFWLDVQTGDKKLMARVLDLFALEPLVVENVLDDDCVDIVMTVGDGDGVVACILADRPHVRVTSPAGKEAEAAESPPSAAASRHVPISAVAFRDWIVTLHAEPFAGLAEVFKRLQSHFNRRQMKRLADRRASLQAPMQPPLPGVQATKAPADIRGARALPAVPFMSTGFVLATLIEFVLEESLPDPTSALTQVDQVDEMVLTVQSDQEDLLRRMAVLRRSLCESRRALYAKEKFIQQLLTPSMRTMFVARERHIHEQYKRTLAHVLQIAEELDIARDTLSQAQANFVSLVSLHMDHSSAKMNSEMTMLSQVAAVCMPLNIVAGLFGMNVNVPFFVSKYPDTLIPFFVIVGICVFWVVIFVPFIYRATHKKEKEIRRGDKAHVEATSAVD